MTRNKILLPLLVTSTIWLSVFSMKPTNTIENILLKNTKTIAGAAYFKIHTKNCCEVNTNSIIYPTQNTDPITTDLPNNIILVSFCDTKGNAMLFEKSTDIEALKIEEIKEYAKKRLDPEARHQITYAIIGRACISFYNEKDDEVCLCGCECKNNKVPIKNVQDEFKNVKDIDLSNLAKVNVSMEGLCILQ